MSAKDQLPNIIETVTATIASSGTTSNACALGSLRLFGIITPAALTGTALTFLVSYDGVSFNPLYDANGSIVTVTVGVNRYIALDPTLYAAVTNLQIVSNASEAAARSLQLVLRGV